MENNKGYIHLYTGNGKGKTTAAIGLSIRAVGAGMKVYFAQFVKGQPYSELISLKRFPEIKICQFGLDCFIINNPTDKDIIAAQNGLKKVSEAIKSNYYDMIILDEICIAIHYDLISIDDVVKVINLRNENTEIILTGRYAPEQLIDIADLVTEMKEIKHYYNRGIVARRGIEF